MHNSNHKVQFIITFTWCQFFVPYLWKIFALSLFRACNVLQRLAPTLIKICRNFSFPQKILRVSNCSRERARDLSFKDIFGFYASARDLWHVIKDDSKAFEENVYDILLIYCLGQRTIKLACSIGLQEKKFCCFFFPQIWHKLCCAVFYL